MCELHEYVKQYYESKIHESKIHDPISYERIIVNIKTHALQFFYFMINRLIMGSFRYGLINSKPKVTYDRLSDIKRRLVRYQQTGNDELLVDIANLALMEYCEGTHPKKHFKSVDDKEHTSKVENAND